MFSLLVIVKDINFIRIATNIMIGADYNIDNKPEKYTGVKVPQFSFNRLANADNRLGVEIKDIEDNAKIYASSAEDLAKLTRDAKIAEATYTVIIEQVKSQSLAAGFKPDTFKVFEYATAPISPSSPNRNFLLAVGASIGFLVGCFVVFLNATRRSVFYTKSSLISKAGANLSLKSTSFLRVAKLSPDKISTLSSDASTPKGSL